MTSKIINAFISHIQEDEVDVQKLKNLMEGHGITVSNYSITSDNFNNAKSETYIKGQILGPYIRQSSVLIVHVAPETKESKWVNWEIEYAHTQGKRIVGVWQRGAPNCELPEALEKHADAIVGWNGESIIDAVNGDNNWYKQDGSSYFKVVPLVDGFAPGVDPDNLKEILNEMDAAAYLEQERGSRERKNK